MLALVVLVGMGSALIFGSADFLGGLAAKRINPVRVTAVAAAVGLGFLLLAYPLVGGSWSWDAVLFGGISGICGALAISLLYACLAIGPMSILSPLTAVVSAIVPALIGILVQHNHFGVLGYIALCIALLAVVLVGFVRDPRAVHPTPRGIIMAVGSGVFIGLFLVFIDLTPSDSGLVPLIANRTVNAIIMFATVGVVALFSRRRTSSAPAMLPFVGDARVMEAASPTNGSIGDSRGGWRPGIRFAIACGVVDAFANSVLLLGLRIGDLSVMAVLSALYPAGTIILAAVILRERIAIVQYIGLALALAAGALLALD